MAQTGNVTTTTHSNPNYIVGYYVNPNVTPISNIDFNTLKSAGITDIYVLVTNNNYSQILLETQKKADIVGIKTNSWVYPDFNHASKVAQMKIGVHLDMETYDMPKYLLLILAMRWDTYGETFSITVKPNGWDGTQYYHLITPLCD
ncbi:MAG: hypothetical protein PHY59_08575 [Methanobacterium sp.]|nr:hypothetical protein [Methanobacterium sp.]